MSKTKSKTKAKGKIQKKQKTSWELSKHDGECDFCGGFINKGDEIVVTNGMLKWHQICYEEGLPGQELSIYQQLLWDGRDE